MYLNIKNTFIKELPADPIKTNARRQVNRACFSYVTPRVPSNPTLIHVSQEMLSAIGLEKGDEKTNAFLATFTGATIMPDTEPYAMCYAGHQFGSWAGQLGDGRAINLGEVVHNDKRWSLQLKGSGETPYSRTADGLAVLRSSVREHLCSEAMFHLGVPTTRSLSLSVTGDKVLRDIMYNGNREFEKGAVVCRVAPSFVRFGNFEIFAAKGDHVTLKTLMDYTIRHFYPEIQEDTKPGYIQFFKAIADRALDMVIHWERVGFVHGVMNTDNMSILGLTIDYGPYGWLEGYDDHWTPNTTDNEHRRYRFGNQAGIALWNLFQLANTLLPVIEDTAALQTILDDYKSAYSMKHLSMMRSKLGLHKLKKEDTSIIADVRTVLQLTETDMTIFFRKLSNFCVLKDDDKEDIEVVKDAFYKPEEVTESVLSKWQTWFDSYRIRLEQEEHSDAERRIQMNQVNPKYVLRNYMAQLAIDKANKEDYSLIEELYQLLKRPYDEQPNLEEWFAKRPEWARNKVGCSMLSCSS